jgi:hypothetical protein
MEDDFEFRKLLLERVAESLTECCTLACLWCVILPVCASAPESCSRVYESSKTSLYSCTCHMLCAHVLYSPAAAHPRLEKGEMKIDGPNRETFPACIHVHTRYINGRLATHSPLRERIFNHPRGSRHFLSVPLSNTHLSRARELRIITPVATNTREWYRRV